MTFDQKVMFALIAAECLIEDIDPVKAGVDKDDFWEIYEQIQETRIELVNRIYKNKTKCVFPST